jgi:hypothetical protein
MALTLSIRAEIIKNTNKIRVEDLSDYAGNGISLANVRGVLVITDPNSNYIVNNADFDNPDIDGDVDLTSTEFDLNLVSGAIPEGSYDIEYSVDTDNDDVANHNATLTFDYSTSDLVTASLEITSSVADATIQSVDNTSYGSATLTARTHTLTDPNGSVNTETSLTEDAISLTTLSQGRYVGALQSTITIPVSSTYYIYDVISTTVNHDVWGSDGITDLESGIATLFTRYQAAISTDNGREKERLEDVVVQVEQSYTLYKINRDSGDRDGAATYLNEIVDLLSAEDITILPPTIAPIPVTRIYNGYANLWRSGSGAPAASLGNDGDYYYRTDTNQVYGAKSGGSWGSPIGTLGANTIIQFSANGTSGWTTTYANGLNYIRFSGDGGVTWTNAAKFIGGYPYYSYADDASGTNAIFNNDTGYTFDASKEFYAFKIFDEEKGNGDLTASDYTGLYTRYKGEGVAFSVNPGTVLVPKDQDGVYDYTNATTQIVARRGGDDLTTDFTYTKGTESNVTATVGASTGLVTITNLSSSTGYVDVVCSKSGVASQTLRIYVKDVLDGSSIAVFANPAVIGVPTTADGNTPDYNLASSDISIFNKDIDVTGSYTFAISATSNANGTLNSNTFTVNSITSDTGYVEIECSRSGFNTLTVRINIFKSKQGGATLDSTVVDDESIEYLDSWFQVGNDFTISVSVSEPLSISNMTSSRIALTSFNLSVLRAYDWDGTDWSLVGNSFSMAGLNVYSVSAMSSTRVAVTCLIGSTLRAYDFDGTNWSLTGNALTITGASNFTVAALSSTEVALADGGNDTLSKYSFDGTDWTLDDTPASITGATFPMIAALSSTSVVLTKTGTTLQKYEISGGTWITDGNATSVNFMDYFTISSLGGEKIVVHDGVTNAITNYEFDGDDWNSVDTPFLTGATGDYAITTFNYPQVAAFDHGDDALRTFEFEGGKLSVKDDGVTGAMLKDSAKQSGYYTTGTISYPTPTEAEIDAILGTASSHDPGYHAFIRGATNAVCFVTNDAGGLDWFFVYLTPAS